MSLLTRLDFSWDIEQLLKILPDIAWDDKNRCDLNRPTGHWLYDPYELKEEYKSTAFGELLSSLPFEIGEARLMNLSPGTCYCAHADIDDRYHLNLISSEQSYLIDLTNHEMFKLETDGFFYRMDAGRVHTAVNWGSTDRVQLVIRIPLERCDGDDFVRRTVLIKNPPYNFRYVFDSEISPFLNRAVKDKKLGWFNPINETKIEFFMDRSMFEKMISTLSSLHKEIEIYD